MYYSCFKTIVHSSKVNLVSLKFNAILFYITVAFVMYCFRSGLGRLSAITLKLMFVSMC